MSFVCANDGQTWSPASNELTLRERQNSPSVSGFPECQKSCTRGRIALGEERLSRVPQRSWHSVKSSTRQRPFSPSATLGEDRHSAKKHVTWWFTPPTSLKLKKTKILPRVPGKALGEEFLFFFVFYLIFLWGLPTLFKTACSYLGQFWLILFYFVSFFRFVEFFFILRIWTAGAWNNGIWWFKKLY